MRDIVQQRPRRTSWLYVLLGIMSFFASIFGVKIDRANAACTWGIRADITDTDGYRSHAACGFGESDDGSFSAEVITDENSEKIQKITLKNYHGGSIYGEYCGSGGGGTTKAIIELVGENAITAEGGVGINLFMPVEFTGEGSLQITAMIPIGGGSLCGICAELEGSECKANVGNQLDTFQTEQLKLRLGVHTLIIKPTIIEKEVAVPTEPTPPENTNPDEPVAEENKCPDETIIKSDSGEWDVWDVVMLAYIGISVAVFAGLAIHWGLKRRKAKTDTNWANRQSTPDAETQQSKDNSKPDVL